MANEFKIKKGLIVDGTNTVLDIQGTQGQLFSVTDSLTGDLFSVSDISGIPILNVNSTGLVTVDGNLNLDDNNKIQFGNSQDLQIYHNANDSYINDTGTGDLRIVSSATKIYDADMSHLQASFTDGGSVVLYNAGNEKLATTSTGISVTGKTTTGTAHFDGNANGSGPGAEIGRNHAYDTLELKGYGSEMMIGSQGTDLHINYRTCNSNTTSHTPNRWFWRAGSSTSYSDHYFGEIFSDGLITWSQGNSSHLGTGAAQTTYVGNSSVNNAAIKSNSNTEDMWVMNWGDSAAWGIYNRNIDSSLVVANAITLPANSTAFIGAGLARTYIDHSNGNIGTLGTVEGSKLKILGSAGYFYNDAGTRTAFYGGDFYIQSIGTYYNYATSQYHGGSSGDNHYFRGNPLTGNNWSIDAAGKIMGTDLTFGNSPGASGTGKLIIQNDTSGNQGTAGYGILKQRDVNKEVVAGQQTHIGGYIWYTIKIPSGYSNSGLGSDVEVLIRTGGRHHNGKTLQKYIINVGNGSTQNIGNFNGINILQTLDSRIAGSYGGSATAAEFYYRTSVANDTGEVILRLYRADREPVTVVEINPQGAWNNDITKTPSLVCHGLGTTFDSGTGKGQINETRPTANLSEPLVIQKASFEQTTGTGGEFIVSANGPASGNSHEIARFVNVGSLATSSYMYIGASSGNDWRVGKNINGTAGNTNFGIAKHSGTTLALEIDGSDNATFAGTITGAADFKATGNNLKFHAGGNHILNIDLNGKVYPHTDNSVDLGFSTTVARFRNGYFTSNVYAGAFHGTNFYGNGSTLTNVYSETESNAKFLTKDGSAKEWVFEVNDEGNMSGNRWYKVATVNQGSGGLHIRGFISNHVEEFGTQKFDLAIQGRETNPTIEINGQVDVFYNGTGTSTDKSGIRVVRATDETYYDKFDVWIRTTRYSQVRLHLTKSGGTSFHTSTSLVTTEPAPLSPVTTPEIDTSTYVEGGYIIVDSLAALSCKTTGTSVVGSLTAAADVIAYSDERLKENVKTLDGSKVLQMRGVSFDRLDNGKYSSGVIAQELEKVAPELVIDDGKYKGVAYGNITGYLIEAIKEQQKQINELKSQMNTCNKTNCNCNCKN
jgi:hypothetical protein